MRCIANPALSVADNAFFGSISMDMPRRMEIIRYPAAIESISRRLRLARPQPRLTLRAIIKIPISTPVVESHVRSKGDTCET